MRKLLLILLILSLAAAAFATVLQVSGVGPAAAGTGGLPDPGTVTKVYYTFSGGQITHITVEVSWSVASGTYTIGVEAVDTDVSPPNDVLAYGEITGATPSQTTYTIDLSPDLGFQQIQDFDTVRVYIVQTGA